MNLNIFFFSYDKLFYLFLRMNEQINPGKCICVCYFVFHHKLFDVQNLKPFINLCLRGSLISLFRLSGPQKHHKHNIRHRRRAERTTKLKSMGSVGDIQEKQWNSRNNRASSFYPCNTTSDEILCNMRCIGRGLAPRGTGTDNGYNLDEFICTVLFPCYLVILRLT